MPGYTSGSIAFLDIENIILISGDPIQDGKIFMLGPQRNILSYFYGLQRIKIIVMNLISYIFRMGVFQ
jgi:hypothetical protein